MELNKKRITKEQKYFILQEHFEKGISISELARIYKIHPVTIYQWKRKMAERPKEEQDLDTILKENEQLKKDKERLTKALGEATLDVQTLKEINEFLKKKYQNHLLKQQKSSSKKKARK